MWNMVSELEKVVDFKMGTSENAGVTVSAAD